MSDLPTWPPDPPAPVAPHAASHATGGDDEISPASIGAATQAEVAAKQDSATAATDAELAAHQADTTAVHGIADTAALATKAEVAAKQDSATAATDAELAAHEADTTAVHGIADTSKLATTASPGVMPAVIGCLARKTAGQEIKKEIVTVLSWSGTVYDDGDCWVVGNPTRLTVPAGQGGLYAIQWTTTILPSSLSGEKEIWLRLNGNENLRIATQDFIGPR